MKKIPEHVICNYMKKPPELICTACGGIKAVLLPAKVEDFVKLCESFAESHKYCKVKK